MRFTQSEIKQSKIYAEQDLHKASEITQSERDYAKRARLRKARLCKARFTQSEIYAK